MSRVARCARASARWRFDAHMATMERREAGFPASRLNRVGQTLLPASVRPLQSEAFAAVYRLVAAGLEGHYGRSSAC